MPVSAHECAASATIDADPVMAAATDLATAISRLAVKAMITVIRLSEPPPLASGFASLTHLRIGVAPTRWAIGKDVRVTTLDASVDRAVQWAGRQLDTEVSAVKALQGGMTSTMLRLELARGGSAVLRLLTQEPWRTHGAALSRREQDTQRVLAPTPVPAPSSVALDTDGEGTGHPAHLMSLLPGVADLSRTDLSSLDETARLLAQIHDVRPTTMPREYQSWAWPAKWVVPEWTRRPELWRTAFAILAQQPTAYEPTFLHRDFSIRNLLWQGDRISGVVDWVETSTGPAWLDVAHAASNLAVIAGPEPAALFWSLYAAHTGREADHYWDVMDIVGFLPPPGKASMWTDPTRLARLEAHLGQTLDLFP